LRADTGKKLLLERVARNARWSGVPAQ